MQTSLAPIRSVDCPERALWAAIVADAIDICVGRSFAPLNERIAARQWVESSRARVGGFLWCCHLLGLDEGAVRAQVDQSRRTLATRPPWHFRDVRPRLGRRCGRELRITPRRGV